MSASSFTGSGSVGLMGGSGGGTGSSTFVVSTAVSLQVDVSTSAGSVSPILIDSGVTGVGNTLDDLNKDQEDVLQQIITLLLTH